MRPATAIRLASVFLLAGCGGDFVVKPIYNHANGRVVVELSEDLDGRELYVRTRRGSFGTLDCKKLRDEIQPIAGASGSRIDGPVVDPALTKPFYGPEWANNPTPEMLAQAAMGTDSIIDVCIFDGNDVDAKVERDLFQAWDDGRKEGIGGKADDQNTGEVTINSAQEYGVRCVAELGEIPFFEKTGDNSYSTYDCLESTPIPMTITHPDGSVDAPQAGTVNQCDNPQYIYSLCEAGPRVAARTNDKGTRWVLLCRKSIGGFSSNQFNDIAMIGHNPFTGKTCFFQNALYSKTDGGHVPHPADKDKSTNLWSGVHGGLGSGIECNRCHDADPFIHSPWIDGAKDAQQRPIVPKMGVDPDLALGANDTPYAIVNLAGQHWRQEQQLVSSEANACLRCHRIGAGQWANGYMTRLEGTDSSWTSITTDLYNQPAHKYWMPPDTSFPTETSWSQSDFARAAKFIEGCGSNPSSCTWQDIPHSPGDAGSGGKLRNPVNLPDDELAKQATTIIGMNKNAPSQECAECHAPTQSTLQDWSAKSDAALSNCLAATDGGDPHDDKFTDQHVGHDEFKTFGPFDVASGSFIEVHMTGTGDADLYVKRGEAVSTDVYDCRPYTQTSNEDCTQMQFNATGPARFYVGVNGFADANVSIEVKYQAPGNATRPPKEIVDCMRLEPGHSDSPYTPAKLGVYAAAAHLGWFQDVFKAAYPDGQDGNSADTWAIEYGKFKNRVSMPKGNHPRLSQGDFDIVAEWFARGMPRLTTYIAVDTGPSSCTPNISSTVGSHVNQMATQGWRAVNRDAGLNMYGCGGGGDPRQCLTSLPNASQQSYGSGWANTGTLRVLRALTFNTFYWMRSSADGRFIANGATGGDGAMISDLQANKDIGVKAAYDPGFFPDNRGWVFQGTPIGAGFCTMSLLTSDPDHINFSEPQCGAVESVSLYQHLGAGLGGADYFVINSQFTSDNPFGPMNTDPSAEFGGTAQIKLTPMVFDGTHYSGKTSVSTASAFEGDSVLSPSTTLIVSRFGNSSGQLGYVLRQLNTSPSGNSYTVSTPEIARYCVQGAKPAISFDERYMVFHHYVGSADYADLGYSSPSDPAFADILAKGSSNIVVVDLLTGSRTRVTTMHAGQYALYPHFRSDGWIYFLVRDKNTNHEYAVASDAAL
jgi:Bacterial pre-peptidase C-terminal domain